jgi:hypothetical protein
MRSSRKNFSLTCLVSLVLVTSHLAAEVGEEVELSSGAVTALSCAKEAMATGKLDLLSSCPLSEAQAGFVVFDVAEKKIYRLSGGLIYTFELARAFAGGSIDFTGKIINEKDGVAEVAVTEYSVTPKVKPGSFKGCL